jgi:DNA-binding response OmpR family regulator
MGPKKILVIEDEEIITSLLDKKLTQEGYEVIIAEDGEKGLEILRKIKPDLILLDLIMPRKGGFEVMEEMQKDGSINKAPIIIISNSGQPVELEKARKMGAKDWLIKTEFDPQELLVKIKKQLI